LLDNCSLQQLHFPLKPQLKLCPEMISNSPHVPQLDHRFCRMDNRERLAINQFGTPPSCKVEWLARIKVKRKLPSLGTDPKSILASVQIRLRFNATTGNERFINPTEPRGIRSANRRCHRLALPLRSNCDALAATPLKQNNFGMPSQKLDVAFKSNAAH
jgi:hypothetical protein